LYQLSHSNHLGFDIYMDSFESISDASKWLFRHGFSYINEDHWVIEEKNVLTQFQFTLYYTE